MQTQSQSQQLPATSVGPASVGGGSYSGQQQHQQQYSNFPTSFGGNMIMPLQQTIFATLPAVPLMPAPQPFTAVHQIPKTGTPYRGDTFYNNTESIGLQNLMGPTAPAHVLQATANLTSAVPSHSVVASHFVGNGHYATTIAQTGRPAVLAPTNSKMYATSVPAPPPRISNAGFVGYRNSNGTVTVHGGYTAPSYHEGPKATMAPAYGVPIVGKEGREAFARSQAFRTLRALGLYDAASSLRW